MEYNRDIKRRQEITGFSEPAGDDVIYFEMMTAQTLRQLIDEKFADPEVSQHDAPSIEDICKFLEENEGFTAHGYLVGIDRDDYRVSIEGVEFQGIYSTAALKAFIQLFRFADELEVDDQYLRCWYD
jgi:hypothetical protein